MRRFIGNALLRPRQAGRHLMARTSLHANPTPQTARTATSTRATATTAKDTTKHQKEKPKKVNSRSAKNIEETRRAEATDYGRQTPREHVLLRPQMYVGSTERVPTVGSGSVLHGWDFQSSKQSGSIKILPRDLDQSSYSPALCKVFDEILVNAADNRLRDKNTTLIEVVLDPLEPRLTVTNNGRGLPVERHPSEELWVPELVFGHLLTGSNFSDGPASSGTASTSSSSSERKRLERLTGGRHGYGAKLANILAHEFTIDTYDPDRGLRYRQTWTDHMAHVGEALIEAVDASAAPWHSSSTTTSSSTGFNEVPFGSDFDGSKGFTRVSFAPDLSALSPSFDGTSKSGGKGAAKQSTRMHTGDLAALRRRAVEMAGCLASQGVKVSLDGHPVPVASFADFARMFMSKEATESAVAEVGGNGRWEVVVCPASALRSVPESDTNTEGKNESSSSSGGHVSFVNGMATPRGGTHITHAVTPLVKALADAIAKRNPELSITPAMVKQATVVYVSAQIENPTFDSQMKECLATRPSAFGSAYVPSKPFVRRILETTSLEEEVVEVARRRSLRDLNKQKVKASGSSGTRQKLLKIPKLDDAYYAGAPSKALDCTLILTEGDSAKALAVAGLEVVGRDTFGVFPLRGKLLNARDATKAQLLNNAELMALCSILNLDFNKTYKDGPDASMRYGSVMIMADQDHDGSHIKGLIINFFHKFWPALLQHDGFLQQFATPVLKATPIKKGASKSGQNKKASPNETLSFYSTSDYDRWRKTLADKVASAVVASRQSVGPSTKSELDKWRVKYYKGLGTSTAAEAKAYFADLKQHQSNFVWQSSGSGDSQDDAPDDDADNLIDLVFNKSRAADRRAWLLEHCAPEPLPPQQPTVSYTDFVNRELVHFSHADNVRSIPSVLDGLKPSQRKLLYACFKRKLTDEVKVAQLSGYCAEHTAYHHGETSMQATIVHMAQSFVGTNNVPLLEAAGQFGTRLQGGKDAASARYIFTRLSHVTRLIFPEADDTLLPREEDDGMLVEPVAYAPIIPLVLINGVQGIGTGWSTSIPPHHPLEVLRAVAHMLNNAHLSEEGEGRTAAGSSVSVEYSEEPAVPLLPWFRGFVGNVLDAPATNKESSTNDEHAEDVQSTAGSRFVTRGVAKVLNENTVEVSELPVGRWVEDYKKFLHTLVERGEVITFKEGHTEETPHFTVTFAKGVLDRILEQSLSSSSRAKGNGKGALSSNDGTPVEDERLYKYLKLDTHFATTNMVCFSPNTKTLERYPSAYAMLDAWFPRRLELYAKRKAAQEATLLLKAQDLADRARFIELVLSKELDLASGSLTAAQVSTFLDEQGFGSSPHGQAEDSVSSGTAEDSPPESGDEPNEAKPPSRHAKLLAMPLSSLTTDRVAALANEKANAEAALEKLQATPVADLWRADLAALEKELRNDPKLAANQEVIFTEVTALKHQPAAKNARFLK